MISAMQRDVGSWHRRSFPGATAEHIALVLAEEAGEVCRVIVKRAFGHRKQTRGDLGDELGDVLIVLCALAESEGIDLEASAVERWAAVHSRSINRP